MEIQNLELYAKETVKMGIKEILEIRDKLPTPIEKFHLFAMPESLYLDGLMVKSGAINDEITLALTPDIDIELYVNSLTETFCEKWDMDPEEYELYFSNLYDLPVCLYWMEMIKAVREIVAGLKKEGVEFSKSAEVGIWFDDDYEEDEDDFKSMAFGDLNKFPKPESIREFLEMFYAKKKTVDKLLKELKEWQQAEEDAKRIDFPDSIDAILEKGIEFSKSLKNSESIPYFEKVLELDPDHTDGLERLARAYTNSYDDDHKKKAIEAYHRLIEQIGPKDYFYYNLGHAYKGLKDYDKVIACYKKAGELDLEEKHYTPYYIGKLYYSDKEDYDKAITFFKEALSIKPDHESSIEYLASIYKDLGNYDEAIKFKKALLDIDPDRELITYEINGLRKKKIEKCIEDGLLDEAYEIAKDINPEEINDILDRDLTAFTLRDLGDAFQKEEEYDKAILSYQKAIEIKQDDHILYNQIATCYYMLGDYDTAISYYEKSVEVAPRYINGWNNIAHILIRQDKLDLALSCYKKSIEHNPEEEEPYYKLGLFLYSQGDYKQAVIYLEKACEIDLYSHPDKIEGLIYSYVMLKEYDKAIEVDSKALEMGQDFYDAMVYTYYQKGDYKKAIARIDSTIPYSSMHPNTVNYLAISCENIEDYDKAIEYYKNGTKAHKNHIILYGNYAYVLVKLKKLKEAKSVLEEGIKIFEGQDRLPLYLILGHICLIEDKEPEAIDYYTKSLAASNSEENFKNYAEKYYKTPKDNGVTEEKYLSIINTIK